MPPSLPPHQGSSRAGQDRDRLEEIVELLDRGASIHAIAEKLGITRQGVQHHVQRALRLGLLVRIDGRGRHKRAVYRRPARPGQGLAPAEQPVAETSLPPQAPGPTWRRIEHAEFVWKVTLGHPQLVPWDPASAGMKNGTRVFSRRHAYLGQIWGTVQLYSGTFRAVLHLDKVPVRWSDAGSWDSILFSLAVDAQARLARDLADLGTSVDQTIPEPLEDPKATAARKAGDPYPCTGELTIPVEGADQVPRMFVNATTEFNRSPPGPQVETGSIKWGYVADHLPDRVIALERWNEKLDAKLDELSKKMDKLDQLTKLVQQNQRIADLLEKIMQPKEPEPTSPAKVERSKGPGDYVG